MCDKGRWNPYKGCVPLFLWGFLLKLFMYSTTPYSLSYKPDDGPLLLREICFYWKFNMLGYSVEGI
jgi:hypothetical protein